MFGPEMTTDATSFFGLVEETIFFSDERQCIRSNIFLFPFRKAGDDCRIDSTAQKDAEWDVTDELAIHGFRQSFLDSRFQFLIWNRFEIFAASNVPVAGERNRIVLQV